MLHSEHSVPRLSMFAIEGAALHLGAERRAGDVLVAPLHDQNVIAALANVVVHLERVATHVLHLHLLARALRAVHADVQDVVACRRRRYWQTIIILGLEHIESISCKRRGAKERTNLRLVC